MQHILHAHLGYRDRGIILWREGGLELLGLLFIHWFIMWPLERHLVILQFNVAVCRVENKAPAQTTLTVISQSSRGLRGSTGSMGSSEQPLCVWKPEACSGWMCSSETASSSYQGSGRVSLGYQAQQLLLAHHLNFGYDQWPAMKSLALEKTGRQQPSRQIRT